VKRSASDSASGGSDKHRVIVVLMVILLGVPIGAYFSVQNDVDYPQGAVVGETGDDGLGGNDPISGLPDNSGQVAPAEMSGTLHEDEAIRVDLEGIAQEVGISFEEAERSYGWHNDFSALVNRIRTTFPADFSAAAIGDDDKPWISFAGKVPADAVAAIGAFAVPVRTIEGRAFTEIEMKRRLHAIHSSVVSDERIVDAVSGYDIVTGVFDITVQLSDQGDVGPVGVVNELRQALPDSINSLDLDIEFRVVNHSLGEQHALVGGGVHLSTCTAGFVIENSSGVRNITTAAHCRDNQTINDNDFNESITLKFEDFHEGRWGDVQRHSVPSGHRLINTIRFNSGDNDFRFITATDVATPGQWLRKYGMKTGMTSDRVYNTNVCVGHGTVCGLVAMRNDRSKDGDSGGPWFYGSTAYGIHKGDWFFFPKVRDVFTPVDHIDEALGDWEVATS
jgi:hypothetical protein